MSACNLIIDNLLPLVQFRKDFLQGTLIFEKFEPGVQQIFERLIAVWEVRSRHQCLGLASGKCVDSLFLLLALVNKTNYLFHIVDADGQVLDSNRKGEVPGLRRLQLWC
ncbi:hypothetical protein FGO68_gene4770 [Halteria grandinella]|uniref:Uncharacterized protein n=1 Tax=Halteria grandinella TaxID=5974 RepID=A0A8J8NTX4_HALGN|nr:hypothetical protein FGO68_gene4770 [Halteria grandinella]